MPGENCSTSCLTKDHLTFGECMKAKNVRVGYCQSVKGLDYTRQKKWDQNLDDYRAARAEGIEPRTTWPADVEKAKRVSDETGEAAIATR